MEFSGFQLLALEYTLLFIGVFLAYKCFLLKKRNVEYFARFVYTLCLALFANVCFRYAEIQRLHWPAELSFWICTAAVITMTASIFFWFIFVLKQIDSRLVDNGIKRHVAALPVAAMVVVCILNRWNGWLYSIDEWGHFHRGEWYILRELVAYGYIIVLLIINFKHIIRRHGSKDPEKFFQSLVPVMLGVCFQLIYGGSFVLAGLTVCALIMYIDVCMDRQKTNEVRQAVEKMNSDLDDYAANAKEMHELFLQTSAALSSAIDAKDKYTQGHSQRVADYSKRIAAMMGMSETEQSEVYYAALLHDVGKIGVKDVIINKEGKLTREEFEEIKTHTTMGFEILQNVTRMPFLSIGAHYHHERYDGKGYPEGLKGEEIPVIARIISVADAYDAMTSKRSYREIIPQWTVREQIVMGLGTQFDPDFGRCMINMIDLDGEFVMQEMLESAKNAKEKSRHYEEFGTNYSNGQQITEYTTHLKLTFMENENCDGTNSMPSFVFYDSLDAKMPESEARGKEMNFAEFITLRADGQVTEGCVRKLQESLLYADEAVDECFKRDEKGQAELNLEMVKYRDHLRVRLDCGNRKTEYIAVLPDATRYVYVTITGAKCDVEIIDIEKSQTPIDKTEIPRIAEELSFKDGPIGDIPNIQMDEWRGEHSEKIKVTDKMHIRLHTLSLPTSRLIWHCPFVIYYASDNHELFGPGYLELAFLRMDGEYWSGYNLIQEHKVNKLPEFTGWEEWKAKNKAGVEAEIFIERDGDRIITKTCNQGIEAVDTLLAPKENGDLYLVLTGDQCAISNIRIE